MRILVTGSSGGIGRALMARLAESGRELRTFDRTARPRSQAWEHVCGDLRDITAARRAAEGMDAVVHLAAIANDRFGLPEEILSTNVMGTVNMLHACAEAGVRRFVFFSSVNALGSFQGHRTTAHFPIDDTYAHHPMSPYQLSKHLGEEACRSYTERYDMVTVCLRPAYVVRPEEYGRWATHDENIRGDRFRQDYWCYVDLRDVCDAAVLALDADGITHDAFLLCARDTMMATPTAELVSTYYSEVPWTVDRDSYLAGDPYRSLVDCSHAQRVLGWTAARSWRATA